MPADPNALHNSAAKRKRLTAMDLLWICGNLAPLGRPRRAHCPSWYAAPYVLTMCGKFTQMMSWGAYVTLADLVGSPEGASETVTPMRFATVIRLPASGAREAA